MKAKDTSVWEQYVEYIVLVVAIAILGWFAWSAFGTKIEHRQGKLTVYAGTVDDELIQAADALNRKIKDGTDSPLDITAPEALHEKFSRQLAQSIAPKNRVVFPSIDMTSELDANQNVQSELREYVSPSIPEPTNMRSRQWFGTIAETEMTEVEGLAGSVEGPPHDTMWIQVAGSVDIEAIIASYGENGELSAIPSQWYDSAIDIFDVEIQRQRKVDTGWTTPEVVTNMPGRLTYRERLVDGSIDAIERDVIIRNLRDGKQNEVIHPAFYNLKGFSPEAVNNPAEWTGEIDNREKTPMQLLEQDLQKAEDKVQQQEELIEEIQQDIMDAGSGGGDPPGGGGRGGDRGGGGGGGRGGDTGSSNDRKIERLEKRLEKAQEKLQELIDDTDEISVKIDELKIELGSEEGVEVLSGEVWVWGHDINVEQGETYRYRMLVQLANPFFGHKPSLYPEQHSLANLVVMASSQSQWSDPITVQKTKQWFVKKAKTSNIADSLDLLDQGYVSIDVFEFSDGAWTRKSRDIEVGQPIAMDGTTEGFGWFLLDVIEDVQGEVVILQSIETGKKTTKRANNEADANALRQLLEQIKEQSESTDVLGGDAGDDSGDTRPPGGGRGGGSGGPAGGGRP